MSIILLTNAYSRVIFSTKGTQKVIQTLDSNKAHGHGNIIIIGMLKIPGDSICIPAEMILKQTVLTGLSPFEWKNRNIAPIQKKANKQNIKNYRSVSLLPVCGRILKELFLIKKCLTFFPPINSFLKTIPVLYLLIPVSTNCYQLLTIF